MSDASPPPPPRVETASPQRRQTSSLEVAPEFSYLFYDHAGSPFRVGILGIYRPRSAFGLGLHLDSNLSDEILATARVEGRLPLASDFYLSGAVEAGLRFFLGQDQEVGELGERPVHGAIFTGGVEAAIGLRLSSIFSLELFGRLLWAPDQSVSADAAAQPSPPVGASAGGLEITGGVRIRVSTSSTSHHEAHGEDQSEEIPSQQGEEVPSPSLLPPEEAEATHQALTQLQSLTEEISPESSPEEVQPDTTTETGLDPEQIQELRDQLHTLRQTFSGLQVQLDAAFQTFRDLEEGQLLGQALYMRRDRLHDGLWFRPGHIDPQALEAYLRDMDAALGHRNFRLFLQSRQESFITQFIRNSQRFREDLQRYLRRLPRSEAGTRSQLESSLAHLSAQIGTLETLQQHQEDTQPQRYQLNLWRETLERLRQTIEDVGGQLPEDQAEQLRQQYTTLNESFLRMTERVEIQERIWQSNGAIFGLYEGFHLESVRARANPQRLLEILREMSRQLEATPVSYRQTRQRNLENLARLMEAFVARLDRRPQTAWQGVRAAAMEIIQWIHADYQPQRAQARRPNPPRRTPRSTTRSSTPTGRTTGRGAPAPAGRPGRIRIDPNSIQEPVTEDE